MENHSIHTRTGLPDDMRVLLRDYPRDAWPDHPNFAESTQHWMQAHTMFRRLAEVSRQEVELYMEKAQSPEVTSARLSRYGNMLVGNLHGHHTWEDRQFFPELKNADKRFNSGLETLENDHIVLDETLGDFTLRANRVIKLIDLDEKQALENAGPLHESLVEIEQFLARHLSDEEDLVVPIIIHHKLRG